MRASTTWLTAVISFYTRSLHAGLVERESGALTASQVLALNATQRRPYRSQLTWSDVKPNGEGHRATLSYFSLADVNDGETTSKLHSSTYSTTGGTWLLCMAVISRRSAVRPAMRTYHNKRHCLPSMWKPVDTCSRSPPLTIVGRVRRLSDFHSSSPSALTR